MWCAVRRVLCSDKSISPRILIEQNRSPPRTRPDLAMPLPHGWVELECREISELGRKLIEARDRSRRACGHSEHAVRREESTRCRSADTTWTCRCRRMGS